MGKISIAEFEAKVQEKEEVVIKIRAPRGTLVDDYSYERKAAGNNSITEWIENRIKPCLDGLEVEVVDGDYSKPHGRTKMDTLRSGYER
jgi:hypothetical protein